jgi:hypothetical protein
VKAPRLFDYLPQVADADGVIALSDIRYVEISPDNPVQRSLSALRRAHFQLQTLKAASVTSDALACQIALYDIILGEISDIRNGLAWRFEDTSSPRQEFQIRSRRLN